MANGIPVRLLPPELLAESKEDLEPVPLRFLRRKPADDYQLAAGDVLGIFIEGVLGSEEQLPPINFPEATSLPPSIGFPIPIREDGTLPLPLVKPVPVEGLTVAEAQERVLEAYTSEKEILIPEEARILLTVVRPRQAKILVVREDSPVNDSGRVFNRTIFGTSQTAGGSRRGTGAIIELPANEADVLSALALTGGLPGTDAVNEVVIERGYADADAMQNPVERWNSVADGEVSTTKIPLRLPPGTPPPFAAEDIALKDGDIVFIGARDAEFFYSGGILGSFEVPMPRDYDLNVIEAVARIGGTLVTGGIRGNNFSGTTLLNGVGNPNPTLLTVLRRSPDGRQVAIRVDLNEALRDPRENILVQSGDVLVLQETIGEAFSRYLANQFNISIFSNFLQRGSAAGTAGVSLP